MARSAGAIIIATGLLLTSSAALAGGQAFRERLSSQTLNITTEDDVAAEIRFGRDIAARVLGRYHILNDPELNHYVTLIGTALAANSPRTDLHYYFAVLDSDKVNAFSAPGGYVFITRGALMLAQDEAELAGILAHEIAHITQRHIVNALNIRATDKEAGASLGRLFGAGTDTARVAFTQAVDKAVSILFQTGYSQEAELESDRVATMMLANTGYDPLALRRFLERAQAQDSSDEAINRTHPPSRQRLAALGRLIKEEHFNDVELARNTIRFDRYVKKQ